MTRDVTHGVRGIQGTRQVANEITDRGAKLYDLLGHESELRVARQKVWRCALHGAPWSWLQPSFLHSSSCCCVLLAACCCSLFARHCDSLMPWLATLIVDRSTHTWSGACSCEVVARRLLGCVRRLLGCIPLHCRLQLRHAIHRESLCPDLPSLRFPSLPQHCPRRHCRCQGERHGLATTSEVSEGRRNGVGSKGLFTVCGNLRHPRTHVHGCVVTVRPSCRSRRKHRSWSGTRSA